MHLNLKSPNVLLSEEGVAKIDDVGMVRGLVRDLVCRQPIIRGLWTAPEVSIQHVTSHLQSCLCEGASLSSSSSSSSSRSSVRRCLQSLTRAPILQLNDYI